MPRKLSPDKLLLRLVETTTTPVYLLDGERRIVFANVAAGGWLGQPADQLLGRVCPYAPASAANPAAAGDNLGPPPEVFLGQPASAYVSAATDNGLSRLVQFLPLPQANDERLVLALVSGEPASQLAEDRGSPLPADAPRLHAQLIELRHQWNRKYRSATFLGVSPASQRIRDQIRLAAAGAGRVLIVGPAGSGREHIARAIHYANSAEPGPLVPVPCRLLDAETLQSTLTAFLKRYPPGKKTGAALLLQQVDRLPAGAQHELAEFLRLPGVELAIRSTAGRSLAKLVAEGRFREDLAQALGTLTIGVPALRRRAVDIPMLAQHFLETHAGRRLSGFSADALDQLALYEWPGNVAELAEVVQQCCERGVGPYVAPAELPDRLRHAARAAAHPPRPPAPIQLDEFLAGIERELLERALAAAKGNKTKAATLLGIHRTRLIRRLVQLGLVEAGPVEAGPIEEPVIFEPLPDDR